MTTNIFTGLGGEKHTPLSWADDGGGSLGRGDGGGECDKADGSSDKGGGGD